MTAETWHDTPGPDRPIRYASASGNEPDRFLSLDDAVRRLSRLTGVPAREVRAHLAKPGALWVTLFATYFHDAE